MKMKKIISGLVALMLIIITSTSVYAANTSSEKKEEVIHEENLKAFTGIVKEINTATSIKNTKYVLVENNEGAQVNFIVDKDTYIVNNEKINIGSEFTGYYDANLMTIMIYPPQYKAVVAVIENKSSNLKVDLFDKELVSADGLLKLNIQKETELINADGTVFQGDLSNRKLAVFYHTSTRSIPAQTTPTKVVVLSEPDMPDGENTSYYGAFTGEVTKLTNLVDGSIKVDLKNDEELEASFTVTKETYRTNNEKLEVGSVVTGYYDAKVMRAMVYPVNYKAEVLDIQKPEQKIKVDYFDYKLLSADGTLKIHISSATEVVNQDGTAYKGRPVNRNLVVIYDHATKKQPAQTHPVKVIVLSED